MIRRALIAYALALVATIAAAQERSIVVAIHDDESGGIDTHCDPASDRVQKLYPSGLERYCNDETEKWTVFSSAQNVFDVFQFGAICDGVHDDTGALQDAYDAACASKGTVSIRSGNCLISETIEYCSDTGLIGPAKISVKTGLGDGFTMFAPIEAGVTNATFERIVLDHRCDHYGNDRATPALSVDETKGTTIKEVVIDRAQSIAVWADSNTGTAVNCDASNPCTEDLKITHSTVNDSCGGGYSMFGRLRRITVSFNTIDGVKDDAIAFQDHDSNRYPIKVTASNNIISNANDREGICTGGTSPTGTGNTVQCLSDSGCDAYDPGASCTSYSTPGGIRFYGAQQYTGVGNIISDTCSQGIAAQDGANSECTVGAITGNTVTNAGVCLDSTSGVPGQGISVLDGCEHATVSGNTVYGSRTSGFNFENSSDLTIGVNTSAGNGASGYRLQDVTDFLLSSNTSLSNGTDTSQGERHGFLLVDTGGGALRGTVAMNRARNASGSSQLYGMVVTGSSANYEVWGNNFKSNTTGETSLAAVPKPFTFPNGAGFISAEADTASTAKLTIPSYGTDYNSISLFPLAMRHQNTPGFSVVFSGAADTGYQTYLVAESPAGAHKTVWLLAEDGNILTSAREIPWDFMVENVAGLTEGHTYYGVRRVKERAVTVYSVSCESDSGNAVINFQRDDDTPADLLSSDCTCGTTPTTCTIAAAEDNFAVGNRLDAEHVSGAATRINFWIGYRFD